MKEHNLDQDYPVDLPTDNLYSQEYLKWRQALAEQVKTTAFEKQKGET